MRIFFIHGNRGQKFGVIFDREKHQVIPIDFTVTNNLKRSMLLATALLKTGKPDLVVADDTGLYAFFAYLTSLLARCPYFIRMRGDNWAEEEVRLAMTRGPAKLVLALSRWLYFMLGDFALRKADRIISVSEYLKTVIVRRLHLPADHVTVIPVPVVGKSWFKTIGPSERSILRQDLKLPPGRLGVMATNFRFAKKVSAILHFWPQLAELLRALPDLTLVIAGDGPFLEMVRSQLYGWDGVNRVIFLGQCHNMSALMGAADVFFHLSFLDAFPNVVVEAQALGIPTIVNDSCGMPEQVRDGYTGFIVPNDSSTLLFEKSLSLLTDKELASRVSLQARTFVMEQFCLSRARITFEEVLSDVA